jgi:hypothetical protein
MPTDPNQDWNAIRRLAYTRGPTPPEWPTDVRPLSLDGLQLLGIDGKRQLFWDGERVQIERRFVLSFWQKTGAVLVVFGALGAFAQGVTATLDEGCTRGWLPARWCAKAPDSTAPAATGIAPAPSK